MRKTQVIPKPMLHDIDSFYTTSSGVESHTFTVPLGKRWNLKHISMIRTISGVMYMALIDNMSYIITLDTITNTRLTWTPPDIISLPGGWSIRCWFGASASTLMRAELLYEETDEY